MAILQKILKDDASPENCKNIIEFYDGLFDESPEEVWFQGDTIARNKDQVLEYILRDLEDFEGELLHRKIQEEQDRSRPIQTSSKRKSQKESMSMEEAVD